MGDLIVREKPILFSAPMVRALLAGRKTQTRRLIKLPQSDAPSAWEVSTIGGQSVTDDRGRLVAESPCVWNIKSGTVVIPKWATGDRLWVREGWGFSPDHPSVVEFGCYRADPGHDYDIIKWRQSIHMPRAASRLTLTVTDVRVQRLQDISEEDAKAEGVTKIRENCYVVKGFDYDNIGLCHTSPVTPFAKLWEHINGPDAWEANPWIVALTFTVAPRNIDATTTPEGE